MNLNTNIVQLPVPLFRYNIRWGEFIKQIATLVVTPGELPVENNDLHNISYINTRYFPIEGNGHVFYEGEGECIAVTRQPSETIDWQNLVLLHASYSAESFGQSFREIYEDNCLRLEELGAKIDKESVPLKEMELNMECDTDEEGDPFFSTVPGESLPMEIYLDKNTPMSSKEIAESIRRELGYLHELPNMTDVQVLIKVTLLQWDKSDVPDWIIPEQILDELVKLSNYKIQFERIDL